MPSLRVALAALLDLALPADCTGCGAPGVAACDACLAPLRAPARLRMPEPAPPGLPPTFAVAPYADATRALLVAHKERGRLTLALPLGAALAVAIAAAEAGAGPTVLVPVPTTAAARRARGHDATSRLTRLAAARLRRAGHPTVVLPALRHARAVRDSVGLSATSRAANLAGALEVRPGLGSRLAEHRVVVVDDVVTTGATLAEATRALRSAGAHVVAAATVAATVRRVPVHRRMGVHGEPPQV